jgi:hypothetical protein
MKKIILLLLISFNGFSQIKHPESDFNLFEQKVYWEHIYNVPGKNTEELTKYFQKEVLQSLTNSNLQIIDNSLSFTVNNDVVDYKKYGGTSMGTAMFVSYPMNYVVIVDFKDEKYKITIKEITITENIITLGGTMISTDDITDYFTKKKKTQFSTGSTTNTAIIYYHKYFTDKFAIKNNPTNKDW